MSPDNQRVVLSQPFRQGLEDIFKFLLEFLPGCLSQERHDEGAETVVMLLARTHYEFHPEIRGSDVPRTACSTRYHGVPRLVVPPDALPTSAGCSRVLTYVVG